VYGPARRQALEQELARLRQEPDGAEQTQRLLQPYRNRMFDLSVFIKELKGGFAQWYNRRHGRYGVLWADRFKSVLLEGGEALAAVAAYIELNPVRAGLCADPKDYRYFGYAEALAKDSSLARQGIRTVLGQSDGGLADAQNGDFPGADLAYHVFIRGLGLIVGDGVGIVTRRNVEARPLCTPNRSNRVNHFDQEPRAIFYRSPVTVGPVVASRTEKLVE
jgi:hypothetical protein